MGIEQLQDLVMGGGAGAGLLGSVLMLRRRWSRDRTEITRDRVSDDVLVTVQAERQEARADAAAARADARKAWAAHQALAETVAKLTARAEQQDRELERVRKEFGAFKRMVLRRYPELGEFMVSDFQPLPR